MMEMSPNDNLDLITGQLNQRRGLWRIPQEAVISLLTTSENATFQARHHAGSLAIRVYREGYSALQEIHSELSWIEALRRDEVVQTPAPAELADGGYVTQVGRPESPRWAVAFEFVPGREPDAEQDLVPWFKTLGQITARLHEHGRSWAPPPGFKRKVWGLEGCLGPSAYWGDWRRAASVHALGSEGRGILERLDAALRARLAAYGSGNDRFGLIHADLRLANLLVDGTRVWVIDFDDCGFGWFIYDFAAAVSSLEASPSLDAWSAAWVEGYRTVSPLSDADVGMIPVFVMLRRLMLVAWLSTHAETPTAAAVGPGYTEATVELARRFLSRFA